MPSFLSKVFGRKKDDKDSSPTNQLGPGELLGGKFEAISPNVSPTAAHFLELQSDTAYLKVPVPDADFGRIINEEKEFGLTFFRTKSRPSSPEIKPKRLFDALPPLSLDFDLKDKSAFNGYIFEESNSEALFSDDVLGQRRLNPMEAIVLIRACSKAIISRGLETLGIMTPHWYSASPDVQRRLISNYLRSLDLTASTTAATPSSPYSSFEDEVNLTRSIHDVAAVLRWGLRHVQFEGDSFGTDDGWYKAFLDAEVANDYPPKAFSEKLAPNLSTSHLDLLISTLEIFSSLAAFSEANSTSGSKLSKIFGLWLLTARRVEHKDDWRTFYARWERTGRMLEHLFLARIRNESTDQRMPTRLLELVHKYPFTHGLSPPTTDLQLLPYPQFTTATHPALLVRVQYEVTSQERIPKTKINPSVLIADAFSTKVQEGEFAELWAKITSAASQAGSELPLGNVLANESLRLLSLVADKSKEDVKSPSFSVISLVEPRLQRASSNGAASISLVKPSTESAPLTTTAPLSPIGSDWDQFSASGFLDIDQSFPPLVSTLFDTDIEKTEPRDIPLPISRRSSRRIGRKSLELPRSVVIAGSSGDSLPDATDPNSSSKSRQGVITASQLEVIELDEAFVDFWGDSLLDPIASDWPAFVICKFKPALVPNLTFGTGDETTKKTLKWLVLEQVYSVKPRPILSSPLTTLPTPAETSAQPASPIAQTPTGRRLFNFWSVSRTPSSSSTGSQKTRKTLKTPKVGEMGELIEEDDGKRDTIHLKLPGSKKFKSLDLPGVKRSTGKKSDEKRSTDTSSSTIVNASAAAVAITTAARPATEKQEGDIVEEVNLSTTSRVVAESSDRVLVSESTGGAPKQDVVPVETELPLADVEKAGVATILDPVPELDAQVVDTSALASIPKTAIITDEPRTKELTKNEGDTSLEEDVYHHPQKADRSFLVSADSTSAESRSSQLLPLEVDLPIPHDGEVEQKVSTSSATGEPDQPILDEMAIVSEERQAPLITREDEQVEIFEPSGGEHGGVSEKPELEGGQGALESFTEVPATTLVSAPPESETQPNTKIEESVDEDCIREVPPTEVKSEEAISSEEVGTVPTLSVAEPAPIVDGHVPTGESVAVTPTEVVPSVGNAATKGVSAAVQKMEPDESFVDGVPASVDSSTAIIDHVEEVIPAPESSVDIEAPLVLDDDTSIPTQAAEDFPVGAESAVPQTISPPEVGGSPIVENSSLVVPDIVTETVLEESGIPVEPATDESQEAEEQERFVDAELSANKSGPPIENVTPQETKELAAEPEILEQITTEHAGVVEAVKDPLTADKAPVDEGTTNAEERSPEACAVELAVETPIEKSVEAELPETQEATIDEVPVAGGSPEEPNDAARETFTSDVRPPVEAPLLATPLVVVKSEEILPAEPTSEEPSEQRSEESATEAVPAEGPSEELPIFDEEIPTQLGTGEIPLVESQPPTEETHEEPAIETKLFGELPETEPELSIEEPETAREAAPIEVIQVAGAKDAMLAEAAVLDVPEREETPSPSEVSGAGGAAVPTEGIPLEVPEPAEESLEIPTSEGAHVENIPFADPPPIAEVTPPTTEEPLFEVTSATDEVTATSEELRVTGETPVGVGEVIGSVQRTTKTTTESDAPPENVTGSVPEVSEEATPVPAEESVASVMRELAPEVAETSTNISAVVEGPPEVDEVVNAEYVAGPPTAVDEPASPANGADEDSSIPFVETVNRDLDTSPVQDPLLAEAPTVATPATIEETTTKESPPNEPVDNAEDSAAVEQPSPSLLSATDAEKNTSPESYIHPEEEVSPLVGDSVSVSEEEPPVIVEVPEAVRTVPDASVEASSEVGPQPDAETATELPDTSSAVSEQPAERGDNRGSTPAAEVLVDTDQPIHSQEVDHLAVEGGIIDEPIVDSAARFDLSIDKPDEQKTPDATVASSTTDNSNESSDEERAHVDNRNNAADVTANTLDPTIADITSISEKEPSSIIDPSSVAEPDIVLNSSAEPSSESGDLAPTGRPTDEFSALPDAVPIDANETGILDEVDVPTFVEESRGVAESSGESAAVLQDEPEAASELPNGINESQTAIEAIDTTIVTPPGDDVDFKAVDDAASEPNTAVEKLEDGQVATDVEATADPIVIAEAQ